MREFVSKYFWVIVSVLMLGVDTFMFVNGSVISQPVAFAHIALFWVFLGVTSVIMRLVSEQEITYVKLIARMSNDLEELEKELSNSLDRLEKELLKKDEHWVSAENIVHLQPICLARHLLDKED